jgi:hypothetical protein
MFTKLWCWLMGHDTICMKRFTYERDYGPWTTTSAFKCLRCKEQWQEQWDE